MADYRVVDTSSMTPREAHEHLSTQRIHNASFIVGYHTDVPGYVHCVLGFWLEAGALVPGRSFTPRLVKKEALP